MKFHLLIASAAFCVVSGAALAAPAGLHFGDAGYLVEGKDMTVYVFDKDEADKSNCTGGCAASWPPLMAKPDAAADGDFTLATRADGSSQWAYKGQPLYYWLGDHKPGDATGDGVGGVWHIVKAE